MNLLDFEIALYIVTGESNSDHLEILCYPIYFMDRSFWKKGSYFRYSELLRCLEDTFLYCNHKKQPDR